MKPIKSQIAVLCVLLVSAPWTMLAQDTQVPRLQSQTPHWYSTFTHRYDPKLAPPITFDGITMAAEMLKGTNASNRDNCGCMSR